MEMKLKNIKKSEGLRLRDEVQYQEGQIVSKTLEKSGLVAARRGGRSMCGGLYCHHLCYC